MGQHVLPGRAPPAGRRAALKACPPEILPLLGSMPLSEIVSTHHVGVASVVRWCAEQGVAPVRKPMGRKILQVSSEVEALIGVVSDENLARFAGVSKPTARKWREARGIPCASRGAGSIIRDGAPAPTLEVRQARLEARCPGMLALLGTVPDEAVGAQFGLTRERIRQIRKGLGVSSWDSQRPHATDEAILACLPSMSDAAVATNLGADPRRVLALRTAHGVPRARSVNQVLLDPVRHLFGKISDIKIAAMVQGLSQGIVQRERDAMGIPPHSLSPRCKGFRRIDRARARELYLEGMNDAEVAAALGFTENTMRSLRCAELDIVFTRTGRMVLRDTTCKGRKKMSTPG